MLRDRERGWGCYEGFGWYDIKRCVEGQAYTPVSIQRNHHDQWELAAFRHYDARLEEKNMERAVMGKHPVRAQRLPESVYRADHAARFCQSAATCTLTPRCCGCSVHD